MQTQPDDTEGNMYGEYMYEVQQPTAENRWLGAYKCTICQFAKWSNLAATMAHNQC